MPLRTCVEKPQDCFKNATCRNRLASRTTVGNVLLRKMTPDPFPLLVRESNHPIYSGSTPARNFEIGFNEAIRFVIRGARMIKGRGM